MRKTLAILLLVFNFLTLQGHAQTDSTQKPSNRDTPTYIAPVVVPQKDSDKRIQTEKQQHLDADVRVISTPQKDGFDKAALWINAILALVGCIGIGVGICTLIYLRKQAAEMRRQRKVMVRSLRAMREQGERENKTIVFQYRPRIIVRHATAKSFSKEIGEGVFSEPVRCIVAFQIVNIGGSPAHIVGGDISLISLRLNSLEEEPELKESTHVGIGERTLQPGERENIEFGLDTRIPNDARWTEFYKGASSHSIFLLGTIWYRDELGIPRQTGLHRSYDPKTKIFVARKDGEEEYSD